MKATTGGDFLCKNDISIDSSIYYLCTTSVIIGSLRDLGHNTPENTSVFTWNTKIHDTAKIVISSNTFIFKHSSIYLILKVVLDEN